MDERRREYAEWCALPLRERRVRKLPTKDVEWAEWKGVTTRSLRRWKQEPEVAALIAELEEKAARAAPGSTTAMVGPDPAFVGELVEALDPGERDYLMVRQAIVQGAMENNATLLDLYMKHWGRPYVEAELRAEDFTGEEDAALVDRVLSSLGVATVSAWLAAQQ